MRITDLLLLLLQAPLLTKHTTQRPKHLIRGGSYKPLLGSSRQKWSNQKCDLLRNSCFHDRAKSLKMFKSQSQINAPLLQTTITTKHLSNMGWVVHSPFLKSCENSEFPRNYSQLHSISIPVNVQRQSNNLFLVEWTEGETIAAGGCFWVAWESETHWQPSKDRMYLAGKNTPALVFKAWKPLI